RVGPPRRNRLAVASFVIALVGIPLFGFPGLIAVILGGMGLASLRDRREKGLGYALGGMGIGLAALIGWMAVGTYHLMHHGFAGGGRLHSTDFRPDMNALKDLNPILDRAMRANIFIECKQTWQSSIGSGVILKIQNGEAIALTNRHVIDPKFDPDAEHIAE